MPPQSLSLLCCTVSVKEACRWGGHKRLRRLHTPALTHGCTQGAITIDYLSSKKHTNNWFCLWSEKPVRISKFSSSSSFPRKPHIRTQILLRCKSNCRVCMCIHAFPIVHWTPVGRLSLWQPANFTYTSSDNATFLIY